MQDKSLTGKKIALMVANGFSEFQMAEIQRTFKHTGAKLSTVSVESGLVSGWAEGGWGLNFPVDVPVSTCLSSDFDMVIVLGGDKSVKKLSESAHTKRILRGCVENKAPVVLLDEAQEMVASLSVEESVADTIIKGSLSKDDNAVLMQAVEALVGGDGDDMKMAA